MTPTSLPPARVRVRTRAHVLVEPCITLDPKGRHIIVSPDLFPPKQGETLAVWKYTDRIRAKSGGGSYLYRVWFRLPSGAFRKVDKLLTWLEVLAQCPQPKDLWPLEWAEWTGAPKPMPRIRVRTRD